MHKISLALRRKSKTIGLIPTMGALHQGHLSLIRQARRENAFVVVSIFVNPRQFGPREDFSRYPRNLRIDSYLCKKEGVGIIFYPHTKDIYPKNYRTYVLVEKLSNLLCGKYRPGHFKGVTIIVTKLFNIVQPDVAYFGQKDAQQAIIIKQIARDLDMLLKIKVMPIVRQSSGLAMSSRNKYLSVREREDAIVLLEALKKAKAMIKNGITNSKKIILLMRKIIQGKKSARIQYIEIVDFKNLESVQKIKHKVLIALAVFFGKTRLIDNIIVKP